MTTPAVQMNTLAVLFPTLEHSGKVEQEELVLLHMCRQAMYQKAVRAAVLHSAIKNRVCLSIGMYSTHICAPSTHYREPA